MGHALRKEQMPVRPQLSERAFEEIWDHRTGDYRGRRERFTFSVPLAVKGYDRTGYEPFREKPARKIEWKGMSHSSPRGRVIFLLRLSLAVVFFWFGVQKLLDVSPVIGILQRSLPLLSISPYVELLGLAEIVIAIGLVVDRLARAAVLLMIAHLCGTLSLALISPHLVFAPVFPLLTMEGEFLAKNLVLIAAGLVIRAANERQVRSDRSY